MPPLSSNFYTYFQKVGNQTAILQSRPSREDHNDFPAWFFFSVVIGLFVVSSCAWCACSLWKKCTGPSDQATAKATADHSSDDVEKGGYNTKMRLIKNANFDGQDADDGKSSNSVQSLSVV